MMAWPAAGSGVARGWWSEEVRRMSRRNTRQGKTRRRAERDRWQVTVREPKRPRTPDQGPGPSKIRRFRWFRGQMVLVPGTRMNTVLGCAPVRRRPDRGEPRRGGSRY